jgi:hypothetical protein
MGGGTRRCFPCYWFLQSCVCTCRLFILHYHNERPSPGATKTDGLGRKCSSVGSRVYFSLLLLIPVTVVVIVVIVIVVVITAVVIAITPFFLTQTLSINRGPSRYFTYALESFFALYKYNKLPNTAHLWTVGRKI